MLQVSSQAGWGIVWAAVPRPPWVTGARNTAEAEGPATVGPEAEAGRRRMTPRARRTCPGGFYPRGRASWTSSAVNSWADTHPPTTTTISSSSRLVTARDRAIKYSFHCLGNVPGRTLCAWTRRRWALRCRSSNIPSHESDFSGFLNLSTLKELRGSTERIFLSTIKNSHKLSKLNFFNKFYSQMYDAFEENFLKKVMMADKFTLLRIRHCGRNKKQMRTNKSQWKNKKIEEKFLYS